MCRRNEAHTICFDLFFNRSDKYTVSRVDPCIYPRELIDADLFLFPVRSHGTPDFGNRFSLSFDDDKLAGEYPKFLHSLWVEPSFS